MNQSRSSTALKALRATTLALSLGLALAWAAPAQAAPQYNLSCIACHQMPPLDSGTAKKNPATGAVPGNHQGHSAAALNSCVVCHGPAVTSYNNSHRNKSIELSDSLGYSRKVGGFLNMTSVPPNPLGTCSTTSCHSDGKGHLAATPAWGSAAFSAPGDCAQCHGVAPATGNHPTSGSKHAAYYGTGTGSCVQCHADHAVEAKPFAHATSSRAVQVKFAGGGNFAAASCATVYCHSNGKGVFAAPTWGASLDCTGCHGSASAPGAAALSAKHALHANNAAVLGTNYGCVECHSATVSSNTTVSDLTKHADGSIELAGAHLGSVVAGSCATSYCHSDGKGTQKTVTWTQTQTLDCKGCHGSDAAPAFVSVAGEPNYANAGSGVARANSHKNHVALAADCQNCHSTTTSADGLSIKAGTAHTNGVLDVVAGNGKSFSVVGKTCSNVSCHSGNGLITGVAPAVWGATLGCVGCHGDAATLSSNAHAKHVAGKGYSCATCHSATVSGSSTIIAPALHGDATVQVAGSFTYTAAAKSCATAACHGTSTPSWTNIASGGCGSCHAALSVPGPVIATAGHGAHYSAAYGPNLAASSATSCAVCHVYTSDTAATHVNGLVELNAGYNKIGACASCHKQSTNWTTGRVSCESCHATTGGALSVISGVTAPDKTLAATAGHGKAGINQACAACHDPNGSHISGVLGDNNRLLAGLSGPANTECNFCHANPAKVTAATLNMQGHVGTGAACAACHDAHGTSNAKMVLGTLNATAVSFTGSDFVNVQGTGVCQACHTATAYYKKGVAETNHPSTDCLSCHAHNTASGTAFEPNRACDSCHGYPPAPRKTLSAVNFGVQGNWSSARFEDYSGGGGAHLVAGHIPKGAKASEGWLNCISCHSGGAAAHAKAMPLRSFVQNVSVSMESQYRFSNDVLSSYTSAKLVSGGANKTGSCFNVSCHMAPTPKWSTER
jgi:predicted CxxxxCH...CXXCH cytochrome family protein